MKARSNILRFGRFVAAKQGILLVVGLPLTGILLALRLNAIAPIAALQVGEVLITMAGALSGAVAIAFTISVFLLQSVADLYSPVHFLDYAYDWRQKLTFGAVTAIVLIDFAIGLLASSVPPLQTRTWMLVWALGSCGGVFGLLQLQYVHVVKRLTPDEAIRFVEQRGINVLTAIHRRVVALAALMAEQGVPWTTALATVYGQSREAAESAILRDANVLIELARRLSTRGDALASGNALKAIERILQTYLHNRRDSSVAVPTVVPGVSESDSARLFNQVFEQVNLLAMFYIRSNQVDNARAVVDVYGALAESMARVRFVNQPYGNPLISLHIQYLKQCVQSGLALADVEVAYRSIPVLQSMGVSAVEGSRQTDVYSASHSLSMAGCAGVAKGHAYILDASTTAQAAMLRSLLRHSTNGTRSCFKEVISQMFFGQHAAKLAASAGIINDYRAIESIPKPFYELTEVTNEFVSWYNSVGQNNQKALRSNFQCFARALHDILRPLAEKTDLTSKDVEIFAQFACQVAGVLIEMKYEAPYEHREADADWFLWLPAWIGHQAVAAKDARGTDEISEALARTCLLLLRDGRTEEAETAVECLLAIVKRELQSETGNGFHEPRLLLRACYCAALAIKVKAPLVVERVRRVVSEFDAAYGKKYNSLPTEVWPTTLRREVWTWRRETEQHQTPHIFDDGVKRILGQELSLSDVDRLICRFWDEIPRGSPIEAELLSDWRQRLLRRLLIVLRQKLSNASSTIVT